MEAPACSSGRLPWFWDCSCWFWVWPAAAKRPGRFREAPRAAPQPTSQPTPAVGAGGLGPPAAVSPGSAVPGRSPLKAPALAAASPVPPATEGLPVSPTLEAPAAESASLPLGGHGLPSYLSDAERDCLGGQDISLGVGWLAAGAPGAADVLPCLSDRSLNRMVYLDPQVDSSGILLGAVDCLDESPHRACAPWSFERVSRRRGPWGATGPCLGNSAVHQLYGWRVSHPRRVPGDGPFRRLGLRYDALRS